LGNALRARLKPVAKAVLDDRSDEKLDLELA
jgi:hypothetical protein